MLVSELIDMLMALPIERHSVEVVVAAEDEPRDISGLSIQYPVSSGRAGELDENLADAPSETLVFIDLA